MQKIEGVGLETLMKAAEEVSTAGRGKAVMGRLVKMLADRVLIEKEVEADRLRLAATEKNLVDIMAKISSVRDGDWSAIPD